MARATNRNNIEIMFGFIASMVMILLSLFWAASTFEFSRWQQFANSNSIFYGVMSNYTFWMANSIIPYISPANYFAIFALFVLFIILLEVYLPLFALVVFSFSCFAFFSFIISAIKNYMAFFTITSMAIFLGFVFIKITQRLDLFAFRADFGHIGIVSYMKG